MEISSLSKFFVVRKLTINDVDTIYDMMSKNEIFYQYHPPFVTKESVVEDKGSPSTYFCVMMYATVEGDARECFIRGTGGFTEAIWAKPVAFSQLSQA